MSGICKYLPGVPGVERKVHHRQRCNNEEYAHANERQALQWSLHPFQQKTLLITRMALQARVVLVKNTM